MNFSWQQFCRTNRVPFVEQGPNVGKNNIGIHCPLCGPGDPSEHMVLSLDTRKPFWYCWRNPEHKGRHPARLIAALLSCSTVMAEQIVDAGDTGRLDEYEARAAAWFARGQQQVQQVQERRQPVSLPLPREFKAISFDGVYARRFALYLQQTRGFDSPLKVARAYNLRYCLVGYFAQRLVLPVYRNGNLVSWTARDVSGQSQMRYKTLSDDAEKASKQGYPPALINIKSTVFNIDKAAQGGDTLFVHEGPFDALKVDWYGSDEGAVAVAVFGMPGEEQVAAIAAVASRFKRVAVVLDYAASGNAMRFVRELEDHVPGPCGWVPLPSGVKDPGELTQAQVGVLCRDARKLLDVRKAVRLM
jgi:hypothetical protein